MKHIFHISITLLLFIFAFNQNANAQALDGSYTVTQGSNVTVSIGNAYISTLNKASSVSAIWTTSSSAISIVSRTNTTCTIRGNSVVNKARLNYQCSYIYDGYHRTMNFYYEITVKANVIYITSLVISPQTATMEIGETLQLNTTIYPINATNQTLNWQTENYRIASVSNSGLVTARSAGTVKIWANSTDGSTWADYCTVTINEPTKVSEIVLSATELTLGIGEQFTLSASISPDKASNKTLTWTTSDANIASVNNEGTITAINPGECDIICTAQDGSGTYATCHIVIETPKLDKHQLSVILPNGSFALDATQLDIISFKITPDPGYIIHTVTINGIAQSAEPNGTTITLDKHTDDITIHAVFATEDETSLTSLTTDNIHVNVNDSNIVVSGMPTGTVGYLYDSNGTLLLEIENGVTPLYHKGVLILRIADKTYKFAK